MSNEKKALTFVKPGEKAIEAIKQNKQLYSYINRPKKRILDEDTYTEHIENIIERDFFPDLPILKAEREYIEAVEKKDYVKLRELHLKHGGKFTPMFSSTVGTPMSTFSTPASTSAMKKGDNENDDDTSTILEVDDDERIKSESIDLKSNPIKKLDENLTLDKYLTKNTSEDNDSFAEIMKENEIKHRLKNAWIYEESIDDVTEKQKSLPNIEQQAIESSNKHDLATWPYKCKNSLMYSPDLKAYSGKELIELQKANPREILHENTRLKKKFSVDEAAKSLQEATNNAVHSLKGKYGIDGKEIAPSTPGVNGYSYMGTPSPCPGVLESPLMSWGTIASTPSRLEGPATPIVDRGSTFKVPDIPNRDRIAMELVEKNSKIHRDKKNKTLQHVESTMHTPKFGSSSSELSPAGHMFQMKLGIRKATDKALKASYTPSPKRRSSRTTPIDFGRNINTPSPISLKRTPSLTDNLLVKKKRQSNDNKDSPKLNATSRPKATDFF